MDYEQNKLLSDKELQEIITNLGQISDSENESYEANVNVSDDESLESHHESISSEKNDLQSEEENESESIDLDDTTNTFTAKDATLWYANPLPTGRIRSNNILKGAVDKVMLPPGKLLEDPLDAFLLYMEESIIHDIVIFTNKEATRVRQAKPNIKWKECDIIEMKAFFGLLITAGHLKLNNTSYEILWSALYGPPIFRGTMGLSRFKSILRFIRFDDKDTRNERRKHDKFAPFRDIWNRLNKNLGKYYMPGQNLTVDEQLIPFRGRCPFTQYMPSKPDKYGIKMWWLCDSDTAYPLNGIPYLGKEGKDRAQGLAAKVVESLCEPYHRTNRNVTCDNYFTDLGLAQSLLSKGLTIVGTVRKNKRFIPPQFLLARNRNWNDCLFGFTKNFTLVSYTPKPRKFVILLSSMHYTPSIDEDYNKPEIVTYYNKTKGGVDMLDQLVHEYMSKRKSNRWPFAFFTNALDCSAIAAYVVWTKLYPEWNGNRKDKRRLFLTNIAENLIKPHINRRKEECIGLQKKTMKVMNLFQNNAECGPKSHRRTSFC